jgi:serine/threonine-protein kinase HipA
LLFAYNPDSFWLRNHNININGKSKDIKPEDILAVGEKVGIKKLENIFSDINEVMRNFKYYADKYKYPAEKAEVVCGFLS